MLRREDFSAVILAGGESQRMGGVDKAGMIVQGMPILIRDIAILKEIFPEMLIATNEKRDYQFSGVKVIRDEFKLRGALGGIHAGLKAMKNKAGFFLACDMPFLHNGLILQLVDCFNQADYDAVVPRHHGHIEPLYAVYRKELKDSLCEFLKKNSGSSVKDFLKIVNVYYLDLEDTCDFDKVFKNINTPEDLAEVKDIESKI